MAKRNAEPRVRLGKGESVVTAFAYPCDGPGWANNPVVVIIREVDKKLREEMMQPSELSREMVLLYGISHAVHSAMTNEAHKKLTEPASVKLVKKSR